jgi:hypothetical protein
MTSTPRLSLGSGSRRTSPLRISRLMRLVMVPEVTRVARSSAPGVSWNGGPCRRSADSTSNSHDSSPCSANAPRRAMSRCRASLEIRLSTCNGSTSRSGRWARHAVTRSSTSSRSNGWPGISPSESALLAGGTIFPDPTAALPGGTALLAPGENPSPRTSLAGPSGRVSEPGPARWTITRAYLLTSRRPVMYKKISSAAEEPGWSSPAACTVSVMRDRLRAATPAGSCLTRTFA